MVDIFNITNYNRTENQLQLFLIFGICVAGHNAKSTDAACDRMWRLIAEDDLMEKFMAEPRTTPFMVLREGIRYGVITVDLLKNAGLGRYNTLIKSFQYLGEELTKISSIKHLEIDDLTKIPGVGPKTSRFFLLHTKLGARIACLDTHILKYLRDEGVENVPDATPQNIKEYLRLEKEFLALVPIDKTPATHDLDVWKIYRASTERIKSENTV